MKKFKKSELKKLFIPSQGANNGQVTIIGGSDLFHGAPILSVKVASRIVDMVFFSSPEPSVGRVAELFKSKLFSFIWVPWGEVGAYIQKSDAILIGPGFMRFGSEKTPEGKRDYNYHKEGQMTREITDKLLRKFPAKKWVIDGGSLQVMEPDWIPGSAIVTPNEKEYEILFKSKAQMSPPEADQPLAENVQAMAKKYNCIINSKGPINIVCSPMDCVEIPGGNAGLKKGGVGDVLAGLTVALFAKNEAFLAASAASYITKTSADELYRKVGTNYNADDLADKIPEFFKRVL